MTDRPTEPWDRVLRAPNAVARWRGLAELLNAPDDVTAARPEFPPDADRPDAGLSRRALFALLGAGAGLAGLGACTRAPRERIVPYGTWVPEVTPGVPSFYATAHVRDGYAVGLLVESHEGRPTKVEGLPAHPASLGATGVFEQASLIELYDPHRAQAVTARGEPANWSAFAQAFAPPAGAGPSPDGGAGLHIVMEPVSSPLVASLLARVRARYPRAQVHFHAPLAPRHAWEGARLAFGRPLDTLPDLAAADVVLSLDADVLNQDPAGLRHARAFADRRRVRSTADGMNRLYVAEANVSVTGATADHRLRVRAGDVRAVAAGVLAEVLAGRPAGAAPAGLSEVLARWRTREPDARWSAAVARDLLAHAGTGVVVAGGGQPPEVHALAHALNAVLGNAGRAVGYIEPVLLEAGAPSHGLEALAAALQAGRVDTLLVLGCNPAYSAPADLALRTHLRAARRSAYLGLYADETARACEWFVPAAHALESWGDARAFDGTVSLVQPLIAPLYDGRTPAEVLAVLLGETAPSAHELLRAFWRERLGAGADFEASWESALQLGMVPASSAPRVAAALDWGGLAAHLARIDAATPPRAEGLEVAFYPDGRVYDGRYAQNPWLQELPDPITKLTWDNAALVSPATAARLGLSTEDVVVLRVAGRALRTPVLVLPGHADECVSLALGYGRDVADGLARGVGVDAYALRTAAGDYTAAGATLARTGDRAPLAVTQEHWRMEGRDPIRAATLAQYRASPRFANPEAAAHPTLYHLAPTAHQQWAMSIDLTVCTGCSACVVACQAENNVPVVGKAGVRRSREMHWLRIDRYFEGDARDPTVLVQPMLCQHCERAPCEYVCPVNATVHSPDGLNEQVYNRCVGTRFCSNNCPYKVRRFNYFNYNSGKSEPEKMAMNPDVTVRARGVMEKCTYCVQRIRGAEIRARVAGRPLRDGDVRTACQQACPTRAIEFGTLSDRAAAAYQLRHNERSYGVLAELGTLPRTTYLARLRNPNPALEQP